MCWVFVGLYRLWHEQRHWFIEIIGNNDVRIAFKKTNNALDFVSTIIHEGGHGILEQNVNSNLTK